MSTCRISKKTKPVKRGALGTVTAKGQATLSPIPVDARKTSRCQLAKTAIDPEILDRFKVITLSDVCRLLDKSRPCVYRLIRLRELEVLKTGQQVLKLNGQVCITLASWHAYRRRLADGGRQ